MSVFKILRDVVKRDDRTATIDDKPSMAFPSVDVEKLQSGLDLVTRGEARGRLEEPPSDNYALDQIELEIVAALTTLKEEAHESYSQHMSVYDGRLSRLDLRTISPDVKSALAAAEADFSAEARKDTNYVHTALSDLREARTAYDEFRREHHVRHLAEERSNPTFKIGLIAFLFVLESAANASFFSATHPGGLFGAAFEAAGISVVNIAIGLILGLGCLRYVKLPGLIWKSAMFVSIVALIGAAVVGNFFAAHYRDAFQAVPPDTDRFMAHASELALERLREHSYILSGFQSYLMVAVGLIVVGVAAWKGYTWTERYPGYLVVTERRRQETQKYLTLIEDLVGRLQTRNDDAIADIRACIVDIRRRDEEYGVIAAQRIRLTNRYNGFIEGLQRTVDTLIQTYRAANRAARKTPIPKSFGQSWQPSWPKEEVLKDTSVEERRTTAKELLEAIHASQDRLLAVFREALHEYDKLRDIDQGRTANDPR